MYSVRMYQNINELERVKISPEKVFRMICQSVGNEPLINLLLTDWFSDLNLQLTLFLYYFYNVVLVTEGVCVYSSMVYQLLTQRPMPGPKTYI